MFKGPPRAPDKADKPPRTAPFAFSPSTFTACPAVPNCGLACAAYVIDVCHAPPKSRIPAIAGPTFDRRTSTAVVTPPMIVGTVLNAIHAATAAVTKPGCDSMMFATSSSGPVSASRTVAPAPNAITNASHADTPSAAAASPRAPAIFCNDGHTSAANPPSREKMSPRSDMMSRTVDDSRNLANASAAAPPARSSHAATCSIAGPADAFRSSRRSVIPVNAPPA